MFGQREREREQLDHISGFCHNLTVNTTLTNEARKGIKHKMKLKWHAVNNHTESTLIW